MNQAEIIPIFPTLVYKVQVPNYFAPLEKEFDSQEFLTEEFSNPSDYGWRSKNSQVLDLPIFKDFKFYILNQIQNYVSQYLDYPYEPYKFTQSWVSHKKPGEYHTAHAHPNSIISGVFYYGSIEPNTPQIIFFPNRITSGVSSLEVEPIKPSKYDLKVSPGMLILFPSYQAHSVPPNLTNLTRKSIAFNSIPQSGFGHELSLTRFDL